MADNGVEFLALAFMEYYLTTIFNSRCDLWGLDRRGDDRN